MVLVVVVFGAKEYIEIVLVVVFGAEVDISRWFWFLFWWWWYLGKRQIRMVLVLVVVVFGTKADRDGFGFGGSGIWDRGHLQRGREIEQALLRLGCSPSVPAVFIGGEFVGGANEVISLHLKRSLIPMLKRVGALWVSYMWMIIICILSR
ncbi:hypothetical protein ACLB2K_042062 [Fragaria x ananassa]